MLLWLLACGGNEAPQTLDVSKTEILQNEVISKGPQEDTPALLPFVFPDMVDIGKESNASQIQMGRDLIMDTHRKLPNNVGDNLNCTNCHLQGGTSPKAMSFVGVVDRYPVYRSRTGKEDNLAERINGCFERSMNGIKLAEDSDEMKSMIAYMEWLSSKVDDGTKVDGQGLPKLETLTPNPEHGQELYVQKCAACHQVNGQGLMVGDQVQFPPLWGDDSFNVGAGMARLNTAAAFIKWNMPLGQGGTLTDQEAYDIAAYFTVQPRPDFANKVNDWPKGGKPKDARY